MLTRFFAICCYVNHILWSKIPDHCHFVLCYVQSHDKLSIVLILTLFRATLIVKSVVTLICSAYYILTPMLRLLLKETLDLGYEYCLQLYYKLACCVDFLIVHCKQARGTHLHNASWYSIAAVMCCCCSQSRSRTWSCHFLKSSYMFLLCYLSFICCKVAYLKACKYYFT